MFSSEPHIETRRVVVHGRVQGVGFRWFVIENARELGVRGTVRNRRDGAVEALFQADRPEALEELIRRVGLGPPASRVAEVEVEPLVEPPLAHEGIQVVR